MRSASVRPPEPQPTAHECNAMQCTVPSHCLSLNAIVRVPPCCPVACSDELIRQVTINCAERGLLLLRVRDEIRMAIASYQTLYESSIAFGMRKALQAEQHKADMLNKVRTQPTATIRGDDHDGQFSDRLDRCTIWSPPLPPVQIKVLEKDRSDLDKQLKAYVHKCVDAEAKDAVRRAEEAAKHKSEVDGLKSTNNTLRKELESRLSIPSADGKDAGAVGKDGKPIDKAKGEKDGKRGGKGAAAAGGKAAAGQAAGGAAAAKPADGIRGASGLPAAGQ
jgi:hypothetical protein